MNSTSGPFARLLAVAALAAVPALGLVAPAAPAAHAAACSIPYTSLAYTSGYVVGEKYRICNDENVGNPVGVDQKNTATGVWTKVASDIGTAVYQCEAASPSKRYRLSGTSGPGTLYPCA